jgi:hypothetical protein
MFWLSSSCPQEILLATGSLSSVKAVNQDAHDARKAAFRKRLVCSFRRPQFYALSTALLRRSLHLLSLFPVAMLGHCAGKSKPLKKQVAMIAQKVVDAKHTQQERRRSVAAPNP